MRPGNIRSINYRDSLAVRKRRSLVLKIILAIIMVLAVVAGLVYLVFFSRLFEIKNISVAGLETISKESVLNDIQSQMSGKFLGILDFKNNILFQNGSGVNENFLSKYPVLKEVKSSRKWMHGLNFDFKERTPMGIWCFGSGEPDCHYFDEQKVIWGTAPKTSGFLFMTIEDERKIEGDRKIDSDFFEAIKTISSEKIPDLTIKNIVIPEDSVGDFRIYTNKSFYIIYSLDSNLSDQVKVLKTFLGQKAGEDLSPQYLDLRIDGRVYFK